mmetsp:Transcript_7260/g.7343  ORF Transcript_7260/g.7343 Transcript_7260/m.7343 type:complete len:481 (-) Transcript_7260:770-2212(-)|eukprot:CAMPEP_0119043730 /NCGR_PEP_ID=MMETSP1177-20130426/25291_1 /TAXON_ID=2985 /ORGANISM="Ochromonas sp, Strain CCMP1899" /LENGTH=480 /DNA_ID=CAMNT_0007012485 /DNA_START=178 /DNA_END=1620 /DNA_ORIENTATION=+
MMDIERTTNGKEGDDISSEIDYSIRSSSTVMNVSDTTMNVSDTTSENESAEISRLDRKFYSTTSSVFAEHTISNPDSEQILFCLSTVLQAQIFEDLSASDECKAMYPEFNVFPTALPVDLLSSEMVLRESENDKELSLELLAGNVPTLDTIYSYIRLIKERSSYPTECNIIALIYTNRVTSMSSLPLTMQNWRAIWVVAVILAQKMWDDSPLKTSAFVQILPYFSKQLLRNLELKSLTILQFSTGVKPSLYAKYYFELRSLFREITGTSTAESNVWKPLSIIKARRLEDRSENTWEKAKVRAPVSKSDSTPKLGTEKVKNDSHLPFMRDREGLPPVDNGRKGWQTSSPAQAQAHNRLQMMDMHKESKGKNFNPYVFKEKGRPRESPSVPGDRPLSQQPLQNPDKLNDAITMSIEGRIGGTSPKDELATSLHGIQMSPFTADANGNFSVWESQENARKPLEPVTRTFEDITLTDTSRYVIS